MGRVESINLAVVGDQEWTAYKGGGPSGIDKRGGDHSVWLDVLGVAGDTVCDTEHHGGAEQAVYAYAAEDLEFWAAELNRPVHPGNVGENLTLRGVDCSGAVIGERWQVGAAVLRVTGPRIPCQVFAGFWDVRGLVKRFVQAGRPGAYLAVEQVAEVSVDDEVTLLDRPAHGVTTVDVLGAAAGGRRDLVPHVAMAREYFGPRRRGWLDAQLALLGSAGL